MKQGTISVLLGCHSPIHSLIVIMAWRKLYGHFPNWWQFICILIHDIGHWGKDYLDDYEQKKQHGELGSKIAHFLFGKKGYELVVGHNPYNGAPRSLLHDPDKYSWVIAPTFWMVSNTWFEPKLQRKGSTRLESALMFKKAMKENMETGFKTLGHEIYLTQWGQANKNQTHSIQEKKGK
ncbi:hypothetical protein LCGC14_1598570 [marine sediment metagenome]|uniref:HD domain-containing protein n=1 Tax=marine sediment metagenome TaxID=412755 RepID=A0A0F9LC21_9ZZZZ